MKHSVSIVAILLYSISCTDKTASHKSTPSEEVAVIDTISEPAVRSEEYVKEYMSDSLIKADESPISNMRDTSASKIKQNQIPKNGRYTYDMAFAEWQGKSMGEQVTVIIQNKKITVIYEVGRQLSAKKGEVLETGLIMKHKSGQWIIGSNPIDADLDEIGGCTGGPTIIDFKNKKYWTC